MGLAPLERVAVKTERIMVTFVAVLLLAYRAAVADTVIVVVGASGEPEYGSTFAASADRWAKAASAGHAKVIQIGRDDPTTRPATGPSPTTSPVTDKELLKSAIARETSDTQDPLWIVLIGHGTADGREAKFNLRGPDVSDAELAEWLKPMQRPLAVIDCSASSAPFLNRLSAKGRVIITATRTASEIQFARFGEYLSTAIADPAADLDKDGQTSLLEAFLAASHRVDEFYKQDGRIVTEHALLDDNGDKLGISADWFDGVHAVRRARNAAAQLDGARANQWCLVRTTSEQSIPVGLRTQRDELELAIDGLRAQKTTLPEATYYSRLEDLLIKLAHVYQQIDKAANVRPSSSPSSTLPIAG
jgi:hypothetical protein